jgi:uncharacterized membrane protein YjgN (DUF898 family)
MTANAQQLRYKGTGGGLFALVLKNALLTIVTFGIYSFWARNAIRAFHYSHSELGDEPFTYHGTGGELLRGYLKAMGLLMLVTVILGIGAALLLPGMSASSASSSFVFTAAVYILITALMLYAVNSARRYRLSRSSWRGIRFSFHGQTGAFMGMMLRGIALTIVTLGFYAPFFASERRAFLVNNARFGSEPFVYEGKGRELFGEYIKALLLTIPTLGLYWVWYSAFQHRYFWSHTRIAGARFISTVQGGDLFVMHLTNMLLVSFTFGIATPWAIVRMHQFGADNLMLRGAPEWATIAQSMQAAGAAGEGLAEGLDVDVGIGL